jgi:hypothetical protein
LVHTFRLFGTTLYVGSTHPIRYCLALFWRDWCQSLSLEEVDARSLGAQVRLEANEDEWSSWAEVENFRVPLDESQLRGVASKVELSYLVHHVF